MGGESRSPGQDPLDREPLCVLVGPTAAGKSELGLVAAERAGAEIVSLDSMLVYRGMDVGTAKPDGEARDRVRHHALDVADPPERYHVHRWLDDVRGALDSIRSAGRRALFVGGTGLYLKALVHGLFAGPPFDAGLRARLEARASREGSAALHAELARIDPEAGLRIHPNDAKRVVRGLEVWQQSGRPLSAWQREWRGQGGRREVTIVGLDVGRDRLDARIAARASRMLSGGWIEETRAILGSAGFGPTSIQALGYAEVVRHLEGELPRGELETAVALRTRQFARRQRTWFRGFPGIRWVDPEGGNAVERVLDALDSRH